MGVGGHLVKGRTQEPDHYTDPESQSLSNLNLIFFLGGAGGIYDPGGGGRHFCSGGEERRCAPPNQERMQEE